MIFPTQKIAIAGLVGALYAVVTILLAPLSYGPMQVRVAEAFTVLPFVFPESVWGLYFGCMAANVYGGYGPIDIFIGSLLTLVAAFLTRALARSRRRSAFWLAPLPPVLINALGVAWILHLVADMPYVATALWVGIGQTISCYGLGLPLLSLLLRRKNTLTARR